MQKIFVKMNIDKIINKYFESSSLPNIEVLDNENIFAVYSDIINILKNSPEIELSILQVLSYCLYEVLDNVLTHIHQKTMVRYFFTIKLRNQQSKYLLLTME